MYTHVGYAYRACIVYGWKPWVPLMDSWSYIYIYIHTHMGPIGFWDWTLGFRGLVFIGVRSLGYMGLVLL